MTRPWLFGIPMLFGCASFTVHHTSATDTKTNGFRYYLSAPYLLVKAPVTISKTESIKCIGKDGALLDAGSAGCERQESKPRQPKDRTTPVPGAENVATADKSDGSAKHGGKKGDAGKKSKDGKTSADKAGGSSDSDGVKEKSSTGDKVAAGAQDTDTADSKTTDNSKGSTADDAGNVAIVWLPDYCEQYAIDQSNFLSTQSLKASLNQGWQLASLDSSGDATGVVSKITDLVGTAIGAAKDVAVARLGAKSTAAEGAQARPRVPTTKLYKLVHSTILKPGIYALFTRESKDGCAMPAFALHDLPTTPSDELLDIK